MQINVTTHGGDNLSAQEIFEAILKSRGHLSKKDQDDFLSPPKPTLKILIKETGLKLSTLKNIKNLLDQHLALGHDICIFGDYDADGITATAILWQALMAYAKGGKSRILPFIPDRTRHGYGLSIKAVGDIIEGDGFKTTSFPDFSPRLILTVDNGIVAHEAASVLAKKGIDLVITDHHQVSDTLPEAKVILHTTATSGAGIAWIFSLYLLEENQFSRDLLDLATIGVVADMMPLFGLNRSLVVYGLAKLATSKRPGLLALYQAAKVDPPSISTYTISFGLAPRINAAGRLYDPYDALRLLCATKLSLATQLASKINAHNQDRQELTDLALSSLSKETFTHKIIVVIGDYHEGIIGLIAGKLTELTHKPSIVMSNHGNSLKASARSVPGVNITELLRSLSLSYLSLGGHSQAAGFAIAKDQESIFLQTIYDLADTTIPDALLENNLTVDFELTPSQITLALAKLIEQLSPFGIGNPKPKFLLRNVVVLEDRQLGTTGKHRKLTIESGDKSLEVLLFNTKEPYPLKTITNLVGSIDINVWNNKERVQLIGSYVEN